jgi:hypothetical protein
MLKVQIVGPPRTYKNIPYMNKSMQHIVRDSQCHKSLTSN